MTHDQQLPYAFTGAFDITLYIEQFDEAVAFYTQVFGPSAYEKGHGTRGWQIGAGWLTVLRGKVGNPVNIEVGLHVQNSAEARRLHTAFLNAGATGTAPSEEMMYEPVLFCPARDPFGIDWLILAKLA